MCRNILVKYGINSLRPRNDIDSFKKSLYPPVMMENLSASVDVESLFHSTLHAIITSEKLDKSLQSFPIDASLKFSVKAGLDGSGSHHKRHQLSGDDVEDTHSGSSVNFLGVFMTPIAVTVVSGDDLTTVWENPSPNSIFYTRPITLLQAKESRSIVEKIFPGIQECIDKLRMPHTVDGIINPVFVDTKISMIDGKMVDMVQGDSGAFCHYCDVTQNDASRLTYLTSVGVGGMPITKTVEECLERWQLVQSGEIAYDSVERKGQCHKPLITHDSFCFAILHQKLRSLDFMLKILYHLVAGQKLWSEANPFVKARVVDAKVEVINHIKMNCGGLLVDTSTTVGGNTNTGPVAIRFFNSNNREAICSQILGAEDRENYRILLGQLNVCLSVSESALESDSLIQRRRLMCLDSGSIVMIPCCILHFISLG